VDRESSLEAKVDLLASPYYIGYLSPAVIAAKIIERNEGSPKNAHQRQLSDGRFLFRESHEALKKNTARSSINRGKR
jgi:hypothetical protein